MAISQSLGSRSRPSSSGSSKSSLIIFAVGALVIIAGLHLLTQDPTQDATDQAVKDAEAEATQQAQKLAQKKADAEKAQQEKALAQKKAEEEAAVKKQAAAAKKQAAAVAAKKQAEAAEAAKKKEAEQAARAAEKMAAKKAENEKAESAANEKMQKQKQNKPRPIRLTKPPLAIFVEKCQQSFLPKKMPRELGFQELGTLLGIHTTEDTCLKVVLPGFGFAILFAVVLLLYVMLGSGSGNASTRKDWPSNEFDTRVLFREADLDGNGSLSKTEFKKFLRKYPSLNANKGEQGWKAFFDKVDLDSDGAFSEYEFVKVCQSCNGQNFDLPLPTAANLPGIIIANGGEADKMFKVMDSDKNGSLTLSEIEDYMQGQQFFGGVAEGAFKFNGPMILKALKSQGALFDKGINREEFRRFYEACAIFDTVDTDQSETIEKDEMRKFVNDKKLGNDLAANVDFDRLWESIMFFHSSPELHDERTMQYGEFARWYTYAWHAPRPKKGSPKRPSPKKDSPKKDSPRKGSPKSK